MLEAKYLEVLNAGSCGELRDAVIRFAHTLGFQTATAMTVIDHGVGESEFVTVDNAPSGYQECFNNRELARRNPVMQHCKRQSYPIIWDEATYVGQGHEDIWEEQCRFGYRTGIAVALHLPEGRHFFVGVDRDQTLPRHPDEVTRMVADLQLFAVHAQDSALRLLAPPCRAAEHPTLTKRELEALRWTMGGKTAWEVGMIMGISERTAVHHVHNAMHKLNCINKYQAALKALRLGLIS